MQMFIDGQEVASQPLEYAIRPTAPGLFVGGLPPKALPGRHEPRYFHGDIFAVRIDMGSAEPAVAATAAEVTVPTAHTLVCLPLNEGTGTTTADRSSNRYVAKIEHAQWLRRNQP
jgi:hypothetical protein